MHAPESISRWLDSIIQPAHSSADRSFPIDNSKQRKMTTLANGSTPPSRPRSRRWPPPQQHQQQHQSRRRRRHPDAFGVLVVVVAAAALVAAAAVEEAAAFQPSSSVLKKPGRATAAAAGGGESAAQRCVRDLGVCHHAPPRKIYLGVVLCFIDDSSLSSTTQNTDRRPTRGLQ